MVKRLTDYTETKDTAIFLYELRKKLSMKKSRKDFTTQKIISEVL